MEASHVRLLVVVGLVLLVSLATADRSVMSPAPEADPVILVSEPPAADAVEAAEAEEVARIQAHLLRVERELLEANVAHLTVAQRQNRALMIDVLREYRERGIFPHNHQVTGRRVPVFIDEHGTHCAVGYLIARTGHEDLARRIADTRNLATVPELADIPELIDWLADAGLTVDEAARIQPWYGSLPPEQPASPRTHYDAATAVSAALSTGATVWNLLSNRQGDAWWVPGAAGVATGATGIALAAFGIAIEDDFDDIRTSHIAWNTGLGVLSGFLGARTLALGRAPEPATSDAAARPPARLELATWLPPEGGTGLRLGLRF